MAEGSHYGGIWRFFSESAPNVTFGAAGYPAQADASVRESGAQNRPPADDGPIYQRKWMNTRPKFFESFSTR
jgi:hypothetical protein